MGPADRRTVRRAGRRRAAQPARADAQRGVPANAAGRPVGRGPAADRRHRQPAAAGAGGEPVGRRPGRRGPRSRRPRPRAADRHLPRRRHPPPHSSFRLHHQGQRTADRGPPEQPLGAAHRGPDAGSGGPLRGRPRRPVAAVPARQRRTRPVREPAGAAAAGAHPAHPADQDPHRAGPRPPQAAVHPGHPRPAAGRPEARRAGNRGAGRHLQSRRGVVDEPGRLDQQDRRLVRARPAGLVRRRHRAGPALVNGQQRPTHRTRHRRGQPGVPAGRTRGDLEPVGRTADPDRHHLRPVRVPRPGAVVVRHLRRRSVHPGRHPVRGHPRPGGRRPPVDHHPVDRPGAARLRGLGTRVRSGPGMVLPACDVADRPARTARRRTSG